jgi:hypothetical protein
MRREENPGASNPTRTGSAAPEIAKDIASQQPRRMLVSAGGRATRDIIHLLYATGLRSGVNNAFLRQVERKHDTFEARRQQTTVSRS